MCIILLFYSVTGFKYPLGEADIYVNGGIFQPGCAGFKNYVKYLEKELFIAFTCGTSSAVADASHKVLYRVGETLTNLWYSRKNCNVCAHSYAHKYFGEVFHYGKENQLLGCQASLHQAFTSSCPHDDANRQRQLLKYVPFMLKLLYYESSFIRMSNHYVFSQF